MNVTFKDLIEGLKSYSELNEQIESFDWGNISNISTKDYDYTMMWLTPTPGNNNGSLSTMRFDMYIMDILEQDNSNLLNVMDRTLAIGNAVVAYFWEDNEELDFELDESSVTIQPFDGKFDDHLAGWIFGIEIQLRTSLNACITPIK